MLDKFAVSPARDERIELMERVVALENQHQGAREAVDDATEKRDAIYEDLAVTRRKLHELLGVAPESSPTLSVSTGSSGYLR